MRNKRLILLVLICTIGAGCGTFQSIVKSSFPYTTTLTIPASSQPGKEYPAISLATSFDQNFTKSGNNGNKISQVRIISARLQSTEPADYNIGNLSLVKIYMAKADGSGEIQVAVRTDISDNVGNTMVLDINNSQFLDELVRQPNIRVRMVYRLRNTVSTDVALHVVLELAAYPAD